MLDLSPFKEGHSQWFSTCLLWRIPAKKANPFPSSFLIPYIYSTRTLWQLEIEEGSKILSIAVNKQKKKEKLNCYPQNKIKIYKVIFLSSISNNFREWTGKNPLSREIAFNLRGSNIIIYFANFPHTQFFFPLYPHSLLKIILRRRRRGTSKSGWIVLWCVLNNYTHTHTHRE